MQVKRPRYTQKKKRNKLSYNALCTLESCPSYYLLQPLYFHDIPFSRKQAMFFYCSVWRIFVWRVIKVTCLQTLFLSNPVCRHFFLSNIELKKSAHQFVLAEEEDKRQGYIVLRNSQVLRFQPKKYAHDQKKNTIFSLSFFFIQSAVQFLVVYVLTFVCASTWIWIK